MENRIIVTFLVFIFMVTTVRGQDKISRADSLIRKRGEVYVAIPMREIKSNGLVFSRDRIDQIRNDSLYLYLKSEDWAFLSGSPSEWTLLSPPSEKYRVKTSSVAGGVLQGEAYPTYPAYLEIMKGFAAEHPAICRIDTIGRSVNNRLILAARLGYEDPELPLAFFSSSIHGDELTGFSLMLRLIDSLLTSSGEDAAGNLLRQMNIIINPLSNPDGTYFSSDTSVFGATRFNANFVDLNRNFPDPETGDYPDGNPRQPETESMMKYLDLHPPDLSANFHGGAELLNYPFDTWSYLHADDEWFRFISEEYATQAQSYIPGYMDDFVDGVVRGYLWYEVDGGRQDYVTYFLHGREVTIELSEEKLPPQNLLDEYWKANNTALFNLLRQVQYGIRGEITDSVSGDPLVARLFIPEHDKLHSEAYSDSEGYFFRPIAEGTYDLVFSAEGYEDYSIQDQFIPNYSLRNYQIRMVPLSSDEIPPEIEVRPNPFRDHMLITIDYDRDEDLEIRIFGLSGKLLYHSEKMLHPGMNEVILAPDMLKPGLYIMDLQAPGLDKKIRIVHIR